MDKVTLFEQALQTLGDREYKRDSPTGKTCDLWFPTVMHEALNFGSWSFATKEVTLPPSNQNTFPLPEDCLRPLFIDARHYQIIGRNIQAGDTKSLFLRYISNALTKAEHLPETQPLFVHGVCLLLAARIATKITGQPQLALNLEQMAEAALSEALHMDALTQHSNDQHPLADIIKNSIIY